VEAHEGNSTILVKEMNKYSELAPLRGLAS
jgi:hypothetical protein